MGLFAFLHDICRQNDVVDPGHGQRAADFAAGNLYVRSLLDDRDLDLLRQACAGYTNG